MPGPLALSSAGRLRDLRLGGAGAAGRASGEWCRRATPSAEQFQRLEPRRRRKRPHPAAGAAVQPQPGRHPRLERLRQPGRRSGQGRDRGPALPHRRPGLGGPGGKGSWCRRPGGAGAAAGQRSRAHRLGRLPHRGGRPLRAERQLLGRTSGRAETADPHLADLERAELQVLHRQAQPGRIREAGEALLHRAASGRPRRPGDPRRPLRPAERRPQRQSRQTQKPQLVRERLPQHDVRDDPGGQDQVQRRRPAPLHGHVPAN